MKTREDFFNTSFELLKDLAFPFVTEWPIVKFSIADLPKKTLGLCYPRSASAAAYNEIFLTAATSDTARLIAVQIHELCHAIDDNRSGHGAPFKALAYRAGLRAPYASAKNGDLSMSAELQQTIQTIIDVLGDVPHSELKKGPKEKGRNNNKLVCSNCGWQANTSQKHIHDHTGVLIAGARCFVCLSHSVDANPKH